MNGCLLPAFFAAMHGAGPPVVLPPRPPGTIDSSVASKAAKALPGLSAENELGTANFTVQWTSSGIDPSFASSVADHLEEAWAALIMRDGWDAPMTSDAHKILVWLTPELAAPGLATGDPTESFPTGQPVIYLNPDLLEDTAYRQQVVHHEFVHTTQFHLRDWYGGEPGEAWYWEASAEWLTEHVDPAANGQAWLSQFYADQPGVAFDTVDGGHEYAMFLLNAYLDEHRGGVTALQSVWLDNEGHDWLTEIHRATGSAPPEIWADFVGAYYAGQLQDSELYALPEPVWAGGTIPGHLGAMYIRLAETEGVVALEAGEGTLVRDGEWVRFSGEATIPAGDGEVVLVVTNPADVPLTVSFAVGPVAPDDTGLPQDTGMPDDSASPEDTGISPVGAADSEASKAERSGCEAMASGPAWLWFFGLLGLRRRCASQRECSRP